MHGTRKSAGLVLALALAGLSCVDQVDRRNEWILRLVVLGEYSRALDVHAELEALGCDDAGLRHQALMATLGSNGYGPAFAAMIGRIWGTPPPQLYNEERFARVPAAGWEEILEVAEGLAREEDAGLIRRSNAGARYAASLVLLRAALREGEDPASAIASLRSAVDFCATMELGSEGRFGLQKESRRNASRIARELDRMDDAELLTWLGATGGRGE